jgi:cbb3-type cytochrome oxidase subunit 1
MFLTGALLMVYNLIQTVRSRTTEQTFVLPAGAVVAGE